MYSLPSMSHSRFPLPWSMKIACGGESCQLEATPPATWRSAISRYAMLSLCFGSSIASSSAISSSILPRSNSVVAMVWMSPPAAALGR